jgi:peroxiredoxin
MDSNRDSWVENRLAALSPDQEWQPDATRGLERFREQRKKTGHSKWRWSWLAAGAVAAALPLMAFPQTRVLAQRCISACVSQSGWIYTLFAGNVSSSGLGAAYARPQNRKMAPDFVLDDAFGKRVRLSDLRGKVVLLNFWATWCAPCSLEIPWFIEFQNTHQDSGFTTLGISLDEDGWSAVRSYIDKRKVNYPVMVGNDDVARLYGANSLPATFVIDKSGRIAATHFGLCSKSEYEADIQAILNEQ